jgi:hypothetical protein
MGVIQDLVNRVRWIHREAAYLARTEGVAALARRTSTVLGHGKRQDAPAPQYRQPAPSRIAGREWPPSLMVLAGNALPECRFTDLVLPTLYSDHGDLGMQQLVSVVYVLGRANWPSPQTLAEARRLAQPVVLELLADDSADGLPACDAIVVPAPRAIPAGAPVHVIRPEDGPALVQLLRSVVA